MELANNVLNRFLPFIPLKEILRNQKPSRKGKQH